MAHSSTNTDKVKNEPQFETLGRAAKDPLKEGMAAFDDHLVEILKEDEDQARYLLEAYQTAQLDFVQENGAIDYQKLKEELDWTQKMMILGRALLNEWAPGLLGMFSNEPILPVSFQDEVQRLEKSDQPVLKMGNNLVHTRPFPGDWGKKFSDLNIMSQFAGKDENGKDVLRLVQGSTFVMPRKATEQGMWGFDLPLRLKHELEKKGLKVGFYANAAPDDLPKSDEIHIITLTPGVLPSREVLVQLQKVFDAAQNKGAVQWFMPEVVAAILTLKGKDAKEAMNSVGLNPKIDAGLLASLEELVKKPTQATPNPQTT